MPQNNDDGWDVFFAVIFGLITVMIDLTLLAFELVLEAGIMCLSIAWFLVCCLLDIKQSE